MKINVSQVFPFSCSLINEAGSSCTYCAATEKIHPSRSSSTTRVHHGSKVCGWRCQAVTLETQGKHSHRGVNLFEVVMIQTQKATGSEKHNSGFTSQHSKDPQENKVQTWGER